MDKLNLKIVEEDKLSELDLYPHKCAKCGKKVKTLYLDKVDKKWKCWNCKEDIK